MTIIDLVPCTHCKTLILPLFEVRGQPFCNVQCYKKYVWDKICESFVKKTDDSPNTTEEL